MTEHANLDLISPSFSFDSASILFLWLFQLGHHKRILVVNGENTCVLASRCSLMAMSVLDRARETVSICERTKDKLKSKE